MRQNFETAANVGDTIRAYDFEPRPGHEERFVEGVITRKGATGMGFDGFTVTVTRDTVFVTEPREEVLVPFGTMFGDFEGRVTRLEAA